MKEKSLLATAFVLFLLALPLISFGALRGTAWMWWTGLSLVILAGLLPPMARFTTGDEGDEEEKSEDTEEGGPSDGEERDRTKQGEE